jgi:hypothetical protein
MLQLESEVFVANIGHIPEPAKKTLNKDPEMPDRPHTYPFGGMPGTHVLHNSHVTMKASLSVLISTLDAGKIIDCLVCLA